MKPSHTSRTFIAAIVLALTLTVSAVAQEPNRAAVVVSLGDGQLLTRCVQFNEEEITGYELLNRAGLLIETDAVGMGAAVCRIEETGCPAGDCFCQCKGGGPCIYWSYWHQDQQGEWTYSQVGASLYQVNDGGVNGWVWDVGNPNEAPPPPPVSFEEVCPAPGVAEAIANPPEGEPNAGEGMETAAAGSQSSESRPAASPPAVDGGPPSGQPSLWPAISGLVLLGTVISFVVFKRIRQSK